MFGSTLDKVKSQMHQLLFTPLQKNIKAKSKPRHAGSSTTPRSSTNKKRQQFRHRVAKKLRSRQDQQLEQLTALLRTFSTVFRDGTGPFCAPASTPPFPASLSQLPTFSFLILPLLSTSFPLLSPLRLLINSSTISTLSIVCFENYLVSPLQGTVNS